MYHKTLSRNTDENLRKNQKRLKYENLNHFFFFVNNFNFT